jgi:hypothetical protein
MLFAMNELRFDVLVVILIAVVFTVSLSTFFEMFPDEGGDATFDEYETPRNSSDTASASST